MWRKTAIALIALILLLSIGVFVIASEAALVWAVNRAAERSGGKLSASGVTGSLLYGPIQFAEIRYRTPGMEVIAQRVRIDVQRWQLVKREVVLNDTEADNITVVRHAVEAKPGRPPATLRTAFPVSVHRLRVARIALDGPNGPILSAGPVTGTLDLVENQWSARIHSLDSIAGRATAQARIATDAPFAIEGSAALAHEAPAYEAKVHIGGTLESIALRTEAAAQRAQATLDATLTPYAPGLIEHLEAQAENLDPHYFHAAAPTADLALDLTAQRERTTQQMRGKVSLTNANAGTLDRARIPLTRLEGRVEGEPSAVSFSGLVLDLGSAGRLQGKGQLREGKLDLNVVARRLNLNRLHERLYPTQLSGAIVAKASVDQQRFTLKLTQQDGQVDLKAMIRDGVLTVEQARASAAGGSVTATGQLHLTGEKRLAFKGSVVNFDPSRFGKYRRARINSRFDATGMLAPVLQLNADLDVFNSRIGDAMTAGRIRWRSKGAKTPDIAVDLAADIGDTHARAKGTLFDPVHLSKLDIELELQGSDLSDLYAILGIPLPPTPPFALSGHLIHHQDLWTFQRFTGKVGGSDLAGDFSVDHRAAVLVIRGELVSDTLRLADLSGFIGKPHANGQLRKRVKGQPLFPNEPFNLEKLRSAEADIRLTGRRLLTDAVPFENLTAHFKLKDGVLRIDPLDFGMAGGNIVGLVRLDATRSVIAGSANMLVKSLHIERLVPKAKSTKASVGTMQGRAVLSGTGNSVAAMLGTANGGVTLIMDGGEISDLVLRLMNLDVQHTLVTLMRGDENIPVRCMVGHFAADHGHLRPQPFILDTEHTKVAMQGDIDLGTETFKLRLIAHPKEMSLVALRGPILIEGPFSAPSVRPDLKNAIARGAAAIALGVVATPAAVLIPLFELGSEKDANCKAIVTQAKGMIDK